MACPQVRRYGCPNGTLDQLRFDFFDLLYVAEGVDADADQHFTAVGPFEDGLPGHARAEVGRVGANEVQSTLAAGQEKGDGGDERGGRLRQDELRAETPCAGYDQFPGPAFGFAVGIEDGRVADPGGGNLGKEIVLGDAKVLHRSQDRPLCRVRECGWLRVR